MRQSIADSLLLIFPNPKCLAEPRVLKTRISITIDGKIAKEIESYYREKVKTAAEKNDAIPKLSNIYEEIIEKGWKNAVKKK